MSIDDLVYGFHARLKDFAEQNPGLLDNLVDFDPESGRYDDAIALGGRAADMLVAPALWRNAVGKVYDTAALAQMLHVTRQAIASRVNARTLLAVPGRRSRLYPVWQFEVLDGDVIDVRRVVPLILRAWLDVEPEVEPLTIAAWANAPSEYLDGRRPWELIVEGDDDAVLEAVEATANQRTR